MKKLINNPEDHVMEMCRGMALAHPHLVLNSRYKILHKKEIDPEKVTIISGGGSGHEPAHAGFVGEGMLDGAVCGDIFASPSQIQVYQALRETASQKGTLLVIKNYSGDIMNFKNAAALATEDGISVEYVIVADDIAVEDSLYTVGRRGVAGTVLVHKIAGAAAARGDDLAQTKRLAQKAADHVRSLGFALEPCTNPSQGEPAFTLGEDEMEYGVGIHGEPGIRREKIQSSDGLATRMTQALVEELELGGAVKDVVVMVNGFGATPLAELYGFYNTVARELSGKGITVHRSFVGEYMTSIDMNGASLSLLRVDQELKELIDAKAFTPGLTVTGPVNSVPYRHVVAPMGTGSVSYQVETKKKYAKIYDNSFSLVNMIYLVDKLSERAIFHEQDFNTLDSHAGDGDFGMSIAKGFRALKREWSYLLEHHTTSIGDFLEGCSLVIMENAGGASGPIWGAAFRGAGREVKGKEQLSVAEFADMLWAAVKAIQATGERAFGRGAVVGDKTLIDALVPAAEAWSAAGAEDLDFLTAFAQGAQAAKKGAQSTQEIVARMGRAGTVGQRSLGHPDAGAMGLSILFEDLADAMEQ